MLLSSAAWRYLLAAIACLCLTEKAFSQVKQTLSKQGTMESKTLFRTTVCVMGAGPAGIVLGNILQQNGVDCIVVDKHSRNEIYARGRAGTIESTTVNLLKKHKLADVLIREGKRQGKCEFRGADFQVVFQYDELSGGDTHCIYPQSKLNDSFIQSYLDAGGKLLFRCEGKTLTQSDSSVTVECFDEGTDSTISIEADFVAGCDGYHGLSRASIPEASAQSYRKQYSYRWLAILAYAPPSTEHGIYAFPSAGFAAYLLRDRKVARYYLQIPSADKVEDWPDERVWDALHTRLAKEGWQLVEGEIFDKRTMALRNYVMEPLRHQRLFIAGDAAHIITPMGGKGLNLAIQDAEALAETLIDFFDQKRQSLSYLDRYSDVRLPYIWRAQEFSCSLLNMLHRPEGQNLEAVQFEQQLNKSKLSQLMTSKTFARDFARNFVGIV